MALLLTHLFQNVFKGKRDFDILNVEKRVICPKLSGWDNVTKLVYIMLHNMHISVIFFIMFCQNTYFCNCILREIISKDCLPYILNNVRASQVKCPFGSLVNISFYCFGACLVHVRSRFMRIHLTSIVRKTYDLSEFVSTVS